MYYLFIFTILLLFVLMDSSLFSVCIQIKSTRYCQRTYLRALTHYYLLSLTLKYVCIYIVNLGYFFYNSDFILPLHTWILHSFQIAPEGRRILYCLLTCFCTASYFKFSLINFPSTFIPWKKGKRKQHCLVVPFPHTQWPLEEAFSTNIFVRVIDLCALNII